MNEYRTKRHETRSGTRVLVAALLFLSACTPTPARPKASASTDIASATREPKAPEKAKKAPPQTSEPDPAKPAERPAEQAPSRPQALERLENFAWKEKVAAQDTLVERIALPKGFERSPSTPGSFTSWLRSLPIKSGTPPVLLHNGRKKSNQRAHAFVIDIDTGSADLQQCADAVMRLRAEYLFAQKRQAEVRFNFTSGDPARYQKWREGHRPRIEGNRVSWRLTARPDDSYAGFRRYLDSVFTYAGTASLSRELFPQALASIQPGDVFIMGGYPGHAVVVVDVAHHIETPEQKVFLLAQSYMPAQDMHVLRNPMSDSLSPWYELSDGETLQTPEWSFQSKHLMRFEK